MYVESDRLQIRPIVQDDFESIHGLLSLPETDRYNALGLPEDLAATERLAKNWVEQMNVEVPTHFTLAIEMRNEGNFIGLFGLNLARPKYRAAEIWYKLLPSNWGKGYGTEAARCVINHCFTELNLHRVEAGVAVDNLASIRVLEKSGMIREGRKRKKPSPRIRILRYLHLCGLEIRLMG